MLSAACRYRPCTLRALLAVLKTERDENTYRNYIADMLYILVRSKMKNSASLKRLCELQAPARPATNDRRTEKEIAQHVVDRLRGKK